MRNTREEAEKRRKKIIELYDQGRTYEEIKKETGTSTHTIAKVIRQELLRRQRGSAAVNQPIPPPLLTRSQSTATSTSTPTANPENTDRSRSGEDGAEYGVSSSSGVGDGVDSSGNDEGDDGGSRDDLGDDGSELLTEEMNEEEAEAVLEKGHQSATSTALAQVVDKIRTEAKLSVNEVYFLGLLVRDILDKYREEYGKTGLPLEKWLPAIVEQGINARRLAEFLVERHPEDYFVLEWDTNTWKWWEEEREKAIILRKVLENYDNK